MKKKKQTVVLFSQMCLYINQLKEKSNSVAGNLQHAVLHQNHLTIDCYWQ